MKRIAVVLIGFRRWGVGGALLMITESREEGLASRSSVLANGSCGVTDALRVATMR
jgi:hypothetical protein